MKHQLKLSTDPAEILLIRQIAQRCCEQAARYELYWFVPDVATSIEVAHCNGNPLRLKELLAADEFNLAHDVHGILAHLDAATGKLTDHFTPRYSKKGTKHG